MLVTVNERFIAVLAVKNLNPVIFISKLEISTDLEPTDNVAVLLLECDFYNENNEVIAHSISYIRSDMQSFNVNLHKTNGNKE